MNSTLSPEVSFDSNREFFLSPDVLSWVTNNRGLVTAVEGGSIYVPRIVVEAMQSLDRSGDAIVHLESFWKNRQWTGKYRDYFDLCNHHFQLNSSVLIGKKSAVRMLFNSLKVLKAAGFLEDRSTFLRRFENNSFSSKAIETFGIITANRPKALDRCLRSYAQNFLHFGHQVRILVSDDSQEENMQIENRKVVSEIENELGVEIELVNRESKRRWILDHESSSAREALHFLMFGMEGLGPSYGRNRNALHLLSRGERIFCVDDDTIANTYLARNSSGEIRFKENVIQTISSFENRLKLNASVENLPLDLLRRHGDVTGQSLGGMVKNHLNRSRDELIGLNLLPFSDVFLEASQVSLMVNGLVGDPGSVSAMGFLEVIASGEDLQWVGTGDFSKHPASGEIAKFTRSLEISRIGHFMSAFFSYDNRLPWIPFFPHFRMEDSLFKEMNFMAHPYRYMAYDPVMLEHVPIDERVHSDFNLHREIGISTYEIFHSILSEVGTSLRPTEGEPVRKRQKLLLEKVWSFLDLDPHTYRHRLLEVLVEGKFKHLVRTSEQLQKYRRKIPPAIYERAKREVEKAESILSMRLPLADTNLVPLEADPIRAENLQRVMMKKYLEACLELCVE